MWFPVYLLYALHGQLQSYVEYFGTWANPLERLNNFHSSYIVYQLIEVQLQCAQRLTGHWIVDKGLRTVDSGQRTTDSGHQELAYGPVPKTPIGCL